MKRMKKMMCLLLSLLILIGLMPTAAFSIGDEVTIPTTKWSDNADTSFAGGDGTKENPYLISTPQQLAKLSNDVNQNNEKYVGKFFELTQDIDLSKHRWIPIGIYIWPQSESTISYANKAFCGFLNGKGKKITGMIVDSRTDKNSAGLFGHIKNTDTPEGTCVGAKDLTISDAKIYVNGNELQRVSAGILAGYALTNPGKQIVFKNITVSGAMEILKENARGCAIGGMIGEGYRLNVTSCKAQDIKINGTGGNCGGFIGFENNSVFEECEASGSVSGAWGLGGFVGRTDSDSDPDTQSVYKKCAADVRITASNWRVGGFAGYVSNYGKFENCVAFGNVTSNATNVQPKVGGFIGESGNVTASNCHAAGEVSSQYQETKPGGFVGYYSNGTFTNCSFDSEKENNNNLNPAGEGTIESGVTGESTNKVLSNICMDFYGQHDIRDTTWIRDVEPTCTTAGSEFQRCSRFNEKYNTREIPATGHTISPVKGKQATCTENGEKDYYTCSVCNLSFEDENGTNQIQNLDEWKAIPAIGHKDENKDEFCDICGSYLGIRPGIPSSNDFSAPPVHTHSLTLVSGKPTACTEDGVKDYYKCGGCGRYFEDQNAAKEIKNLNEWKIIKALGHKDANNDYVCDVCGTALGSTSENLTYLTDIFETDKPDVSSAPDVLIEADVSTAPVTTAADDEQAQNTGADNFSDKNSDKIPSTGNGGLGTLTVLSVISLVGTGGAVIYGQRRKGGK